MTGFRGEVKEVGEQTAKVDKVYGRATPVDLALGQIELVPGNSNWGTTRRWARHHTASAICGAVAGVTSRRTRQAAIVPSDLELIEATKEVVTDYLVLDSRSSNALLVTLSRLSR
jgi:hypothetical protein